MMEVLLAKQNFKANSLCKDTVRHLKRKENIQRRKQAREISVQDKRRIPENLEISNESVLKSPHVKKISNQNKKSRMNLLKEWREAKERQKAISKPKKATFLVKHVEHKDDLFSKFNKTKKLPCKDNTDDAQKYGVANSKLKPKVLQERNMNIIHGASIPRQSYLDWKRTQIGKEPFVGKKKQLSLSDANTKQTDKKVISNNNANKTQSAVTKKNCGKSDRVTRSMKSKPDVEKKVSKTTKKNIPNTVNEKNICNPAILNGGQIHLNKSVNKELKQTCELQETEKGYDITYEIDSVALTDAPTSFEAPVGLAFTDFKFDMPALSSRDVLPEASVQANKIPIEEQSDVHPEASVLANEISIEEQSNVLPEASVQANKISIEEQGIDKKKAIVNNDVNKTPNCHRRIDSLSKKNCFDTPKTPVSLFKEKHSITPCTTPKNGPTKRTSLTPNPKNFLSKMEDPVAQRIQSASKMAPHTPPDVSASSKHFSNLVAVEEGKFTANIEKWEKILAEGSIPEDVQGNVLSAVGQGQLLIRKRFKQFKELIELHKDKTAEKAAHASDLDGFWEMINFQVDDVHKRFAELDDLLANGWEVKKASVVKNVKKAKSKVVKKPVQNQKVVGAKSDFKKFREQMKAKKLAAAESNNQSFISIMAPTVSTDKNKIMTPVRRSLRNLNIEPKNSPGICMVIPLDAVEPPSNPIVDEFSADSLEEPSPDKVTATKKQQQSEKVKLRRSARKTPSKYRIVHDVNSENVACNLFADNTCTEANEKDKENFDFSRYLSKTIISEDALAKDDLLFVEPKNEIVKEVIVEQDLMMFSPIAEKN